MSDAWISDLEVLEAKRAVFFSAGSGGLRVVSDWDRTLTYPQTAMGVNTTSYLAIVHGGYLGDGYRVEMEKLYVKYRGAELDANLAEVEKLRLMNEWWRVAFEMLKRFGLTYEMVQDVGQRDGMVLRDGAAEFFQTLDHARIPLQIVSAGLGDVIVAFLRARQLKLTNMDVVANWITFGEEGQAVGFGEPVIHSANKTRLVDIDRLDNRSCVLLLGDTLEDAEMVADFDGGTIIRIGFLNGDTEGRRAEFAESYDVVVGGNGDFEYVNKLMKGWLGE
ncbi:MAG: hypothetical protein O3B73_12680 [bacterium]|nr:hypothetical protein [bacterium]